LIVYDHGFAKGVSWPKGHFVPVNKTSSFTQDDPFVWAYVTASLYTANLTWNWYDPDGRLYESKTNQVECTVTPCTYVSLLSVANDVAATDTGLWKLDLVADGGLVYSGQFSINPVITEEDYWNFNLNQSSPAHAHAELKVIIHPQNQTWRFYRRNMPYAANLTAFEAVSNRTLEVTQVNNTLVTVDLGAARSDGYEFVLGFDVKYTFASLNGWDGGSFAFAWQENPWQRSFPYHPVPETFVITLPQGATFTDLIGINVMILNHNESWGARPSVSFTTMVPPLQLFGWTIIYQDFTWRNAHINFFIPFSSATAVGLPYATNQPITILPVTLGSVSLWSAVMSIFILTGSELLSPMYARTGILIDRRRLRILGLFLVAVFVAVTAYQLVISQYTAPIPAR
jgi:hypothetical protein